MSKISLIIVVQHLIEVSPKWLYPFWVLLNGSYFLDYPNTQKIFKCTFTVDRDDIWAVKKTLLFVILQMVHELSQSYHVFMQGDHHSLNN